MKFKLQQFLPKQLDLVIIFTFLFFLTPIINLITTVNLSTLLFVLMTVIIILQFLQKKLPRKMIILFIIFALSLIPGLLIGFFVFAYNPISVIGAFFYYLKPPAFFLFGYYLLSEKRIEKINILLLLFGIAAFPFYILFPFELIQYSRIHLRLLGFTITDSIYFSATELRDSVLPRNPTLLLSYLDSAYVYYFVTSFFIILLKKTKSLFAEVPLILSGLVIFLSTFTRTTLIALPITVGVWIFLGIKNKYIKYSIVALLIIGGLGTMILFYNQLHFLFVTQGSAAIHWENKGAAIERLIQYPFGTGVGSSGWKGDSSSSFYFYSEGSAFTSLLELGVPFAIWYLFLGVYSWIVSRKLLFPLFLGFFVVSLFLPIGFSTQFTILFFGLMGYITRKYESRTKK